VNTSKRWFLIAIGSGLAILVLVGLLTVAPALAQGPGGMMGRGTRGGFGPGWMMGGNPWNSTETTPSGFGPGWMRGNFQNNGSAQYGPGWMMGGGMHGMMGGSMMVNSNNPFFATKPLSMAETTEILNAYLATLNDSNLAVNDIMIFDNHAYAEIIEKDSGIGVMEVLIDPTTKAVYPEMGPNMMWNLKYGMMSGYGGYGSGEMMGGYGNNMMGRFGATEASAEMTVTPDQAVEAAQTYLDAYFSQANLKVEQHADPFYGYYTLHVSRDGQTVGMLSVNGFSGQVFPHTWHGKLLEMSEE